MKITVNSNEKRFTLRFPSFLIFNGITATLCGSKMINSFVKNKAGDIHLHISAKSARRLFREINRARRKHKDWYIVEVIDDDCEGVKIKL